MKNIIYALCIVLVASLSGCAGRINQDEASEAGAKQLSADNIDTLVAGNSLHMISWDASIEADVVFSEKGTLDAVNSAGEKTTGRWTTDDERHRLCLKFKFWGEGATNCFRVFRDKERYLLFNNDGTLAHTFVPEREVAYTLADMNAGVLSQPPPGSSQRKKATSKSTPAAAPVAEAQKKGGLLSTLTFGLLGSTAVVEQEEIIDRQEFIPAPMVTEKVLTKPHQQLLDTGKCAGCDLSGVDLSGVKLKGVDLAGADLSGANLQEANLAGANLKGANLQSARLTDAVLVKADLSDADLSDANLHWADLRRASLQNANLERAYLVKAELAKADFTGARMKGAQTQRALLDGAVGLPAELLPPPPGNK